jgi:amino-acid N-acetyltransferase
MITEVLENDIRTSIHPLHLIDEVVVRSATEADVEGIVHIINQHARQGHLLPRSAESVRSSIHTWIIAEDEGNLVGCGSLLQMSPTLVEVRSLAVLPDYRSSGVGARIVMQLVEQARHQGIPTVFALTRAVPFFERLGFSVTSKEHFPEKVWRDCAICPLQMYCDETAVMLEI